MQENLFERRLVSLSRIFQGVDVCAAVHYDKVENKVVIATNQREEDVRLTTSDICDYLADIAKTSKEFSLQESLEKRAHIENFKKSIDNKFSKLQEKLKNHSLDYAKTNKHYKGPHYHSKNGSYREKVDLSIKKVTSSIVASYLVPDNKRAFSREFVDSLNNVQQVYDNILTIQVSNNTSGSNNLNNLDNFKTEPVSSEISLSESNANASNAQPIHAEMRIIDKLFTEEKINKNPPDRVFLAISKRCCLNCEAARKAVNKALKEKYELEQDPIHVIDRKKAALAENKPELIGKGHGGIFPSEPPKFLTNNTPLSETIRRNFVQIRNQLLEEHEIPNKETYIIPNESNIENIQVAYSQKPVQKSTKQQEQTHSPSASPASSRGTSQHDELTLTVLDSNLTNSKESSSSNLLIAEREEKNPSLVLQSSNAVKADLSVIETADNIPNGHLFRSIESWKRNPNQNLTLSNAEKTKGFREALERHSSEHEQQINTPRLTPSPVRQTSSKNSYRCIIS